MDEQSCPRCKTTKYRNPLLKLMVNVCGHSLCESCVELLFIRGSAACPECGTALRKNNFRLQYFEDSSIEREMDIRKTVLKIYNRKEEDFATLKEYNDYLEEIENTIFNLLNDVDVEETRSKMERYKATNAEYIRKNRSKLSRDEQLIEELIEMERLEEEEIRRHIKEEELKTKMEKSRNRENLLQELTTSSQLASNIVANHKRRADAEKALTDLPIAPKALVFSSGVKMGGIVPVEEMVISAEPPTYTYEVFELDYYGPSVPDVEDICSERYLQCVRQETANERAGGFKSSLACHRALQEAFAGLHFSSEHFVTGGEVSLMDTS